MRETHFRSVIKSITWRIWGTVTTTVIVYIFTQKINWALYVGGIDAVLKIFFYFLHERFWNSIKFGKNEIQPKVIWFTGLSGSGKTTLALALKERLISIGHKVEHLDGDDIRKLFPETGYSKEDRASHVRRVGYLASRLESHGIFVITSLISPHKEPRSFVRGLCKDYFEVYLSTPLHICEARDAKGLYARARRKEIFQFTGIDDLYEPPVRPNIEINTENISVDKAVSQIVERVLKERKGSVTRFLAAPLSRKTYVSNADPASNGTF